MEAQTKQKGKLVPKLRFKGFKDDLLETKFGTVVESNLYGPRFNADDYSDIGNVKTIRGTDLGRDGEIKYDQVPLAKLDENTIANHKLEEGDIVMITTADCGATGVFRKQKIDYLSSAYGVRIRLNEFGFPYYFKYFFQTRLAKKEINSFIRKATVANLPGSDILKIKVYLPTLPEQEKISSFLSSVDEKLTQLTRKKELLAQYKKGVMQQLFPSGDGQVRKLRFKDENGKEYPKWEEKRLGDIGKIKMCKRVLNNQTSETGEIPFYKIGTFGKSPDAFISRELFQEFITKYAYPKKGDILISASGTLGRTVVFDGKESYYQDSNIVWIENDEKLITNKLLYFVLQIVTFDSEGGTIQRLYNSIISAAKFRCPSLPEQQKISTFLSSIDTKIQSITTQISQTQSFKKGLLQQMFV